MQFSAHFVLDAEAIKHSEALQYKGVKLSWTGAYPAVRDPTAATRRGRADLVRSWPATLSSPLARGQDVGPLFDSCLHPLLRFVMPLLLLDLGHPLWDRSSCP